MTVGEFNENLLTRWIESERQNVFRRLLRRTPPSVGRLRDTRGEDLLFRSRRKEEACSAAAKPLM